MDMYLIVFLAFAILATVWPVVIMPWLARQGVNATMLSTVTLVVQRAVLAAEQMYKIKKVEDRRAYAKALIEETLEAMYIDPDSWEEQIDWLIEAAVKELPKTTPV